MCLCGAAVVVSLAVSGCGTGSYETRMEESLKELRLKSPFLEVLDRGSYEITDAQGNPLGVFVQMPKHILDDCTRSFQGGTSFAGFRTGSQNDAKNTISELRVQPPFMKLRDFCLSFEWFIRVKPRDYRNPEQPVYAYFAVSDATTIEQQQLMDDIQRTLASSFRASEDEESSESTGEESSEPAGEDTTEEESGGPTEIPFQWETLDVKTPEGGTIEWKRIRFQGDMVFDCTSQSTGNMDKLPGAFDLYLHSDDTYHVVMAWRAPVKVDEYLASIYDGKGIMQAAEVCAGTLRIEPPPPPEEGAETTEDSSEESADDTADDTAEATDG